MGQTWHEQTLLLLVILKYYFLFSVSLSHLERAHECLVYAHHGSGVVELAAVVWGREQRHQLPLCEELVSVLHHLAEHSGLMTSCKGVGVASHVCSVNNKHVVVHLQRTAINSALTLTIVELQPCSGVSIAPPSNSWISPAHIEL